MKTKKLNRSGYPFRALFVGHPNEHELVDELKKIAKEQNRSLSGQARQFMIEGMNRYNSK